MFVVCALLDMLVVCVLIDMLVVCVTLVMLNVCVLLDMLIMCDAAFSLLHVEILTHLRVHCGYCVCITLSLGKLGTVMLLDQNDRYLIAMVMRSRH